MCIRDSRTAVDFWFDFSSPYSYIANEWVDALAARHGRTVHRHAILLGATFQAAELKSPVSYPIKREYSIADFARSARFEGLPSTRVQPGMVLDAAVTLVEEGQARTAISLLEPWSKAAAPWPAPRGPLLDLLCDLYLDEGHPRKREKLAHAMVAHGDAAVQSTGWRRLSMMAADAGKTAASQEAFERAQRLTPDDPDVALLLSLIHI